MIEHVETLGGMLLIATVIISCAGTPSSEKKFQDKSGNRLEPSIHPPGGLSAKNVPMFVSIGFDDNAFSGLEGSGAAGGMTWATDTFRDRVNPDGTPARVSFFVSTSNAESPDSQDPELVKQSWKTALLDGHEIGNHTHSHPHGDGLRENDWIKEMSQSHDKLSDLAGAQIQIETIGFRTPFLEYTDETLKAVARQGFLYDCSIEEGFQEDQDGTNFLWPYTLDDGSPGHETLVEFELKKPISKHPGLFEMPVYTVIVPPDDRCERYGVSSGLRAKMKSYQDWFDETSGKITGFDYNLWVMFQMTKEEFLATLKYSFDLRLEGNRAPFLFGAHSDIYSSKYEPMNNSTVKDRQEAIEEFLDYVQTKPEVRILPIAKILSWIRNPAPMK